MLRYYSNKRYISNRNVIDDVPGFFDNTIVNEIITKEYELGTEELTMLIRREALERITDTGEIENKYGKFSLTDITDTSKVLITCMYLKNLGLTDVIVLQAYRDLLEILETVEKYNIPFLMEDYNNIWSAKDLDGYKGIEEYTILLNDTEKIKGSDIEYVFLESDCYRGNKGITNIVLVADDNIFDFTLNNNLCCIKANNYIKRMIEKSVELKEYDTVITLDAVLKEYKTVFGNTMENESNSLRFLERFKGKVIFNFRSDLSDIVGSNFNIYDFLHYVRQAEIPFATFEPFYFLDYENHMLYVNEECYKRDNNGILKYRFTLYENINYGATENNLLKMLDIPL